MTLPKVGKYRLAAILAGVAGCIALAAFIVFDSGEPLRIDEYGNSVTQSESGTPLPSIEDKMEHYGVPGMSIAVIRDGEIAWAKGYGVLQAGGPEPVDTDTMFSVGSVSKVGAATVILKLAAAGELDLDKEVNTYLTSWKIPANEHTQAADVTLRRILSHTAGLTVHGFFDYQPDEELPTTVQILQGSGPAKNGPVVVDIPIGSKFRYSGGGTTVAQLVVEDVTGLSFHEAAESLVLDPLRMRRSTYENPLPPRYGNVAKAHNWVGWRRALPRGYESMPEAAASGLWTTPSEFAKLMIALMDAYHNESEDFLPQHIVRDMMTEVEPSRFGVGPILAGEGPTRVFWHGGANDSYKSRFVGHLPSRNGVVVFTNGARGIGLTKEVVEAIRSTEGWPE